MRRNVTLRQEQISQLSVPLFSCATVHPGAVGTSDQAISIAQQTCRELIDRPHLSGHWHARYQNINWFVWHDPDYALEVTIDTQTGNVMNPGCLVNPRDGVQVGD